MLLKISDIFFMETLGLKFEFNFFQIKEKSIFSASEGGK